MHSNDTIPLPILFFNTTILSYVKEILKFGEEHLNEIRTNQRRYKLKKKVLYTIIESSQNHAQGVVKLITPPQSNHVAADVLVKTLMENYINARYIYADRTHQHAFTFSSQALKEQLLFGISFKEFMNTHPKWKLQFGTIHTPQEWDTYIETKRTALSKHLKKNSWYTDKSLPSLYTRAQEVDQYLEKKGDLSESISAVYTLLVQNSEMLPVNEHIDRILTHTYKLYYSTLVIVLKEFELYSLATMNTFKEYARKLNKV